ncbi:Mitochondrial dicarboxylate carrier [Armadillidium nasatum]|uniref:Mitochondrial dicarboxylate carrier n=1 Tax=Armadillidium nasatum TaxID=96803 RepID=A0A5N5T9I2_9CRUS|nr:Mitochondrial dicarboxylate carrier [Armadillidium nasatum]
MSSKEQRLAKWYFGGVASCGAACFTHPLDTLKVHLQTQQETKLGGVQMAMRVVKTQGFFALYNGLSASLLRQVTYSTTRFAIYERALIAGIAGACGGFVGTPGDMVNVRMQNDIKLPADQRRNYKHALDGVYRVFREEGVTRLFRGASSATLRAVLMTIGQLSFYDQIKGFLLSTSYFNDNLLCHFASSLTAGAIATTMTQPVDVIKTRAMNAKPGEFKNLFHIIKFTAKMGPLGFFKGYIPAFVRLGPHTILTFILFEQLRKNFGTIKIIKD